MTFDARTLRPLPFFDKKKKSINRENMSLDSSPNSLIVDVFGEEIQDNEYKLDLIKNALITLYELDIQLDRNPKKIRNEEFRSEFKKAMRFFLILLPDDDIGGILYFDMDVIFNNRKRIYNMVKPLFYFESE